MIKTTTVYAVVKLQVKHDTRRSPINVVNESSYKFEYPDPDIKIYKQLVENNNDEIVSTEIMDVSKEMPVCKGK